MNPSGPRSGSRWRWRSLLGEGRSTPAARRLRGARSAGQNSLADAIDEASPDTLDGAATVKVDELAILRRPDWQMTFGERAAFEGLVAQVAPELAIEVGSAAGGSLERIAAHSKEVHAIDLTGTDLAHCPANVSFHKGDSKVILAHLLARLAAEGRNVDFIHLDGDHTAAGIRADIEPLLASHAIRRSFILIHDSFNPEVRAGIESLRLPEHPKVRGFDLDFVPGRLGRVAAFEDVGLGGFAAVIVDEPGSGSEEQRAIDLGFWSWNPTPFLVHDAVYGFPPAGPVDGCEGARRRRVPGARGGISKSGRGPAAWRHVVSVASQEKPPATTSANRAGYGWSEIRWAALKGPPRVADGVCRLARRARPPSWGDMSEDAKFALGF